MFFTTLRTLTVGVFCLATFCSRSDAQTLQPCVGLMLPSVRGADGDATAMATSLRDLLASYLAGPRLRVMNIDARLAVQATEEAREKQCEPVLVVTLTRKRSEGGLGKVLGRAAGSGAYYVPYGGSGASAAIRGAAMAGAHAVSELAASTKAKDEMTIDYSLARGGTPISSFKRESLKAKSDGEDLVTPLVEKVAEAVVRTVAR